MEPWQSECIRVNLAELIQLTDCNSLFLAKLNEHQLFLSGYDQAELDAKTNKLDKNKYIYDIAKQRRGMYTQLLMALFEARQTGAFSILMKGFIAESNGGVLNLSQLNESLPGTSPPLAGANKPHLFTKAGGLDVLNEALLNCFTSTQVQISHSWWSSTKYCSEKIETFQFSNSSLFSFLDLLVSKHNTLITDSSIQNMTKEFLSKWVHACVMSSYINLFKIAIKQAVILRIFESKYLLLLAVTYSDTPIVDLILTHYLKQTNVTLPNTNFEFHRSISDNLNYSILDIAALRGSLPVIQTLLRATADDADNMAHLMCLSVVDTRLLHEPDVQIIERKRIMELILQKFPKLIQNWPTNVDNPLLYPNVHVDLINQLISLGFVRNFT